MFDECSKGYELPLWAYRTYDYDDVTSGRSSDELMDEWNIHWFIKSVIAKKGIKTLYPVQEKIVPLLLNNNYLDKYSTLSSDFIITSPTGQGKTLCYLLPIINNIVCHKLNVLSSLIIAPGRELINQIYETCLWFVSSDPLVYNLKGGYLLNAIYCYGNKSFNKDHADIINQRPQILICTPGRFVDHYKYSHNRMSINFNTIKWVVIDEADLLLSQPSYNWTCIISQLNNNTPQKILISATVPYKSSEFDLLKLKRPILVKQESIYKLPPDLTQKYIIASKRLRIAVLIQLIKLYNRDNVDKDGECDNILIFCSKKSTTHHLYRTLEIYFHEVGLNLNVYEFNSNYSQRERNTIISHYRANKNICLLCTDVVSRGLNLLNTRLVINYDFPKILSTYIHRVGRTARGRSGGLSILMLRNKNLNRFRGYMNKLNVSMDTVECMEVTVGKDALYEDALTKAETCLSLEESGKITNKDRIEDYINLLHISY